ncbi:hypothetical protein [Mucilaginibacter gotjawali]|uniref:Uncharacterized protein n=2 Tax=Mucilaginibacter gotjawali TaxID=1550579 RepID=A0A110B2T6_9SPHI|nr:hypothetical protein [Mucilaginibacter gotjawali]MBB3055997.1 hypothetical protein [Mucilaginibacter gotjawali]BAU53667.1 hypothetical protein MgSA37_01836 [Mucilaginibacter gotjawali]
MKYMFLYCLFFIGAARGNNWANIWPGAGLDITLENAPVTNETAYLVEEPR